MKDKIQYVHLKFACILGLKMLTAACLGQSISPTAFTYQGTLTYNGMLVSGVYDFQFILQDQALNSNGVFTANQVVVTNGLFSVPLDFGAGAFPGDQRWLLISIRTNGASSYSKLSPIQPVSPNPYAIMSAGVANGSVGPNQLAPASVGSNQLAFGSVGTSNLANMAVGSAQLADGSVGSIQLASDGASLQKVSGGALSIGSLGTTTSLVVGTNAYDPITKTNIVGYSIYSPGRLHIQAGEILWLNPFASSNVQSVIVGGGGGNGNLQVVGGVAVAKDISAGGRVSANSLTANYLSFPNDGHQMWFKWSPTNAPGMYVIGVDVTPLITLKPGSGKTFVIDDPTDPRRYLVHGTLEGPENAVFYRGQSRLRGGRVTVVLPPYFESLVAEEGRTVQLSCVDGFDRLAVRSGKDHLVENGQFEVYSDNEASAQEFTWEVKAVRKDVPPLDVEVPKDEAIKVGDGPYTYLLTRVPPAK